MPAAVPRHVRLCDLGRRTAATLFCARDRLGIKPFYYYWDGSAVRLRLRNQGAAGASGDFGRSSRNRCCPSTCASATSASDRTLFRGIRKLMPGHHLTLDEPEHRAVESAVIGMCPNRRRARGARRRVVDRRVPPAARRNGPDAADERRAARDVSERRRGFQRHRGVDEGHGRGSGEDLLRGLSRDRRTASLGFARQVAEHLGTEHHEVVVGRDEFFRRAAAADLA